MHSKWQPWKLENEKDLCFGPLIDTSGLLKKKKAKSKKEKLVGGENGAKTGVWGVTKGKTKYNNCTQG